jgi:hypothetical protein
MTVEEQRKAAADAALLWVGTPFADNQHVRGAGVDCAWIVADSVGSAVGRKIIVPYYPMQWCLHSLEERYLDGLIADGFVEISGGAAGVTPYRADRFLEAPIGVGDVVVSRLRERVYCHGGVIVEWPTKIVHCAQRHGVAQMISARSGYYHGSLKFFSWAEWHG